MDNTKKARVIAFYLPQFHPIPENDRWWGKGFTEWTNVGKAKPLFKGHYQPRVPADLGYYDLRMPEVREAQAKMAREAGIEGFCYWHYWFGNGKKLLERPFQEVLSSGKPDFPFCLGWANHSWTNKSWEAGTKRIKESTLVEMVYNKEEYVKHFYEVLPAFKDERYIQVDGKPLFLVFRPLEITDPHVFIDIWQELAKKSGLKGIYFVGIAHNMLPQDLTFKNILLKNASDNSAFNYNSVLNAGYDAVNSRGYNRADYYSRSLIDFLWRGICLRAFKYAPISKCDQKKINQYMYVKEDKWNNVFPTLMPSWDRTARSGSKARIYTNSTPKLFRKQLLDVLDILSNKDSEYRIAFLMSWNEWAEGNYVEPDLKYGHGYLDVLRECLIENK